MSDKLKVYQGVRVKITVRELLQRRRAEANRTNTKTMSQELREPQASLLPTRPIDPYPPLSSFPGIRNLPVPYLASNPLVQGGQCSGQMQNLNTYDNNFRHHQPWDVALPGDSDQSNQLLQHLYQHQSHPQQLHGGQNYQTPGLPLTSNHGLSSDVDYYGPGMLWNPEDHNSHSPHSSFSSSSSTSSSSCYDSPSRMESSFCSPEPYHYPQHYVSQDSYVGHLWTEQQESFSSAEYAPYYNSIDYAYPCPVEEGAFRRDLTAEVCYNAL